jgi:hypothetical protein
MRANIVRRGVVLPSFGEQKRFAIPDMKTLIAILFVLALFLPAVVAATHDVGQGTIEASDEFTFTKGGTDSVLGTLTRKADGFTINFDVGGMAGIHMHDGNKAQCTFYRRHVVGNLSAATGIELVNGVRRISTSIGEIARLKQSPANFWADIRQDSDVAEFLLIVTSFRPKVK